MQATWVNLKNMMVSDRSQTQKPSIVIPFIGNVQNRQLHSDKVD